MTTKTTYYVLVSAKKTTNNYNKQNNLPAHHVLVLPAPVVFHLLHQLAAEALREKRYVIQVLAHLAE